MTDSRRSRALEIYQQALELADGERAAFVQSVCAGDATLVQQVTSLLAAADAAEDAGFLAKPIANNLRSLAPGKPISSRYVVGDRIGHYTLTEQLGEGGFGVVYLAEQEKPISRQVALKLVRGDKTDSQFLQRFEAERQILAWLNHANIAQIYDAGRTEQDDPYLAMEYVVGMPITLYCTEHKLRLETRLTLFQQICAAVQHAHAKGVVHRDLKPANVLVTDSDSGPQTKVIDFGIAKVVGLNALQSNITTVGGQLGSPLYMSPEQLTQGEDVDTRSDVFALGTLLYQLLTGSAPFDNEQRPLAELVNAIVDDVPPAPSQQTHQAGQPSDDPAPPLADVTSELDWIVLKALEKDRERRYQSAADLAADIERFLSNRPVLAKPATAGYRLGKLIARHRWASAASIVAALALIAGSLGTTVGYLRAKQETARAVQAEIEATREARNAQQTVELLTEFLASPDPAQAGRDITVVELLEAFAPRLNAIEDPTIEFALLNTYAQTYQALGLLADARPYADEALALAQQQFPPTDERNIRAGDLLGRVLVDQGQYDAAVAQHRQTLQLAEDSFGVNAEITFELMASLAEALTKQGHPDQAEPLQRDILAKQRADYGNADARTLRTLNRLALTLWRQGRYEEGEQLSQQAISLNRQTYGEDHPATLDALSELALIVASSGRLEDGLALHQEVLQRRRQTLGPEHRQTLNAATNVAWVMGQLGRWDQAEQRHRETLVVQDRVLGASHPDRLATLGNLSTALMRQGRLEEAEPLAQQTLSGRQQVLGQDHPQTLIALGDLVVVYGRQGNYPMAAEMASELLARNERIQGPNHPATLTTKSNLGWLLMKSGLLDEAEPLMRQAVSQRVDTLGSEHPATLASQFNLVELLTARQEFREAEVLAQQVLESRHIVLGDSHRNTRRSMQQVGALYLEQDKLIEARSIFSELLQRQMMAPSENSPEIETTREKLRSIELNLMKNK